MELSGRYVFVNFVSISKIVYHENDLLPILVFQITTHYSKFITFLDIGFLINQIAIPISRIPEVQFSKKPCQKKLRSNNHCYQ